MRLLCLFILSMFLCAFNVKASDTIDIDKLFSLIESSYPQNVNYKKLSLLAFQEINNFDRDFRVYSSDTKAFLYQKNMLIKSFNLPTNEDSANSWKNVLIDIFSTYKNNTSNKIKNNNILKNMILEKIVNNIDDYSRIEDIRPIDEKLNHEIKNNIIYKVYT